MKRQRTYSDETFKRTLSMLAERRNLLERTARRLLEKETLDETEIRQLVDDWEGSTTRTESVATGI